jgi:GNAT superfamily N-acetyltransferase
MPDALEPLFALYRDAFPANERRGEIDLRRALATPAYRTLRKERDGQLIAFAILFIPPEQRFCLIEYLAVHPGERSAGIGRELIAAAIEQTDGRHLLTEVETQSIDSHTHRRQRFYTRCGFRRIEGLRYQLPLPGDPPPMELWMYQQRAVPFHRDDLEGWIRTIYTEVYGCASADPRIAQMLHGDRI